MHPDAIRTAQPGPSAARRLRRAAGPPAVEPLEPRLLLDAVGAWGELSSPAGWAPAAVGADTAGLLVDVDTGQVTLQGVDAVIGGYQIQSASGSLVPGNWTPMGFEVVLSSDAWDLSEAHLLADGVPLDGDVSLGGIFATDGQTDLTFSWTDDRHQTTVAGEVIYAGVDPVVPAIRVDDVTVTEGDSGSKLATFTVTLSEATGRDVSVSYATADGTAAAGSDYAATSGTLIFAAGETSKTFSVTINGDGTVEDDETFAVNLSGPTNATIADATGAGTILNDDAYVVPAIRVDDVTVTEGDSGSKPATFTVTLSEATGRDVSVSYATADGTAAAGSDYAATSGTLIFAAGETSKTFSVTVNGDGAVEDDETFAVNLSGPTNATIADATGAGTILNDDAPAPPPPPAPTVNFSGEILTPGEGERFSLTDGVWAEWSVGLSGELESDEPVTCSVYLDGGLIQTVTLAGASWSAWDGGTLLGRPGVGEHTLRLVVDAGDRIAESDELDNVVERDFTVLPMLPFRAGEKFEVLDVAGGRVQIKLKGDGQGQAWLEDDGTGLTDLILTGTTSATSLKIKTKGNSPTVVDSITVNGSLKDIKGKSLDLRGDMVVTGALGKLALGAVRGGTVEIHGDGEPIKARIDTIVDGAIRSAAPIKTIKVGSWRDTDATIDEILAPWVKKAKIKDGAAPQLAETAAGQLDGTRKWKGAVAAPDFSAVPAAGVETDRALPTAELPDALPAAAAAVGAFLDGSDDDGEGLACGGDILEELGL